MNPLVSLTERNHRQSVTPSFKVGCTCGWESHASWNGSFEIFEQHFIDALWRLALTRHTPIACCATCTALELPNQRCVECMNLWPCRTFQWAQSGLNGEQFSKL